MIISSRMMQATMLVSAAVLHVAILQPLGKVNTVDIAAAGAAQMTAVGNSFADLATGVMTPLTPDTTEVTPAIETQRVEKVENIMAPNNVTPSKRTPVEPIDRTAPEASESVEKVQQVSNLPSFETAAPEITTAQVNVPRGVSTFVPTVTNVTPSALVTAPCVT